MLTSFCATLIITIYLYNKQFLHDSLKECMNLWRQCYPVRIIVPHLNQNWWYITVTSFKWLPNEISLVQERAEQVKPRLLCSHVQIQKGPWTAVNKQNNFYAFSRHRHRNLGLDRHIRSIFFLPIPNKHSIEHKQHDVISWKELEWGSVSRAI